MQQQRIKSELRVILLFHTFYLSSSFIYDMNNQRPPYPMQPQGTRPPPQQHGHPQGTNATVRPPTPNANHHPPPQQLQSMPPVGQPRLAQGFNPNRPLQSPPLVNPSQPGQPPTIMRPAPSPVANAPMTPQQQQQQPRPGYMGHSPSMTSGMGLSPGSTAAVGGTQHTTDTTTSEHHRRKRMYPEQITQAYMDEPSSMGQQQQQQQQMMTPGGQQYGQAAQGMTPYPAYNNQASVSSVATQFGSMSLGASNVSSICI